MVNVNAQIDAVERGLETKDVDGVSSYVQTLSQTYPSPIDDVWDAMTSAERIPRWFLPIEGDATVGGRYQFIGNAGGVVQECDPEHRFAITWEMGGMVSWVEVSIEPDEGGTTLVLRHEAPFDEGFWTQYGPGAVGVGWDLSLMGLTLHLASGAPVDPAEVAAWIQANNLLKSPPIAVSGFGLYSSHRGGEGPHYRLEAEYLF